MKLVNKFCT